MTSIRSSTSGSSSVVDAGHPQVYPEGRADLRVRLHGVRVALRGARPGRRGGRLPRLHRDERLEAVLHVRRSRGDEAARLRRWRRRLLRRLLRLRSLVGEKLTRAERERLQAELDELEGPKRQAVVAAIATAREHGDLSENFESHPATNQQGLPQPPLTTLH